MLELLELLSEGADLLGVSLLDLEEVSSVLVEVISVNAELLDDLVESLNLSEVLLLVIAEWVRGEDDTLLVILDGGEWILSLLLNEVIDLVLNVLHLLLLLSILANVSCHSPEDVGNNEYNWETNEGDHTECASISADETAVLDLVHPAVPLGIEDDSVDTIVLGLEGDNIHRGLEAGNLSTNTSPLLGLIVWGGEAEVVRDIEELALDGVNLE